MAEQPLDPQEHLANRIDEEPVVFRGCTTSELMVILGLAAAFWLPTSMVIAGMLGYFTAGFGLTIVGIVVTLLWASKHFQSIKRGRPDGYYQHKVILWLDVMGLRPSGFIVHSGVWDLGRTN
jgi:conjugative transfer region protein (TIGR03750 family)